MANDVQISMSLNEALHIFQRAAQNDFYENANNEFVTMSGVEMRLLDFSVDDVRLEDIAHGLSNMCRYGGQCRKFYSVAEHSVLVSRYVEHVSPIPGLEKSGLMHGGSEAYIIDLPTPLKVLCPGYQLIEKHFERVIFEAFGLSFGFRHPVVKECDFRMYLRERSILMPGKDEVSPSELDDLLRLQCLAPEEAKRAFLERAEELGLRLAS